MYLEFTQNFLITYVFQTILVIWGVMGNLVFTSYSVFINKIVDKNAGGTFLSVMNSLSNVPTLMFNPVFMFSMNFGYKIPAILILAFHGTFTFVMLPKYLEKLRTTKRNEYELNYTKVKKD